MARLARVGSRGKRWQDDFRYREPSPRIKHAIRLYATGTAKTKKEAAEMMGLSPSTLYAMTAPSVGNEKTTNLHESVDQILEDRTIDLSTLKRKLAEQAVREVGRMMVYSGKDEVKLRAATELMDRNPDTAKITKHEIEAPKIDATDAKLLAQALVEAAEARRRHLEAAEGDFVKVDTDKPFDPSIFAEVDPHQAKVETEIKLLPKGQA